MKIEIVKLLLFSCNFFFFSVKLEFGYDVDEFSTINHSESYFKPVTKQRNLIDSPW